MIPTRSCLASATMGGSAEPAHICPRIRPFLGPVRGPVISLLFLASLKSGLGSMSAVDVLGREVLVRLAHRRRAVTDGGSNPLDRTVAGVSRGEHAGYRRLERERGAIKRPPRQMRAIPHDVGP